MPHEYCSSWLEYWCEKFATFWVQNLHLSNVDGLIIKPVLALLKSLRIFRYFLKFLYTFEHFKHYFPIHSTLKCFKHYHPSFPFRNISTKLPSMFATVIHFMTPQLILSASISQPERRKFLTCLRDPFSRSKNNSCMNNFHDGYDYVA